MNVQYISDNTGKTTGVFIPISDWNRIKDQFKNIEQVKVPDWQMTEVRERLEDYNSNPDKAVDFDTAMDDIEKDL